MREDPGIIWVAGVLVANDRDVPAPIVRQLLDIIEKFNRDSPDEELLWSVRTLAENYTEVQSPIVLELLDALEGKEEDRGAHANEHTTAFEIHEPCKE